MLKSMAKEKKNQYVRKKLSSLKLSATHIKPYEIVFKPTKNPKRYLVRKCMSHSKIQIVHFLI